MESSWSSGLAVLARTLLPEGYALAQMTRDDVSFVTAQLARWYPEIQAGTESRHLQADFYLTQTQLADQADERAILPVVIRERDAGVVAVITYERDVLCRSLACRLGALAPEHRKATLALFGPSLLELIGRAMGAELLYYFATLRTRHQQVIAERYGFQLVGIVPGHDRAMVAPGSIKRVYDALYTKLLVPPEAVDMPPSESLTATTRAVWFALFGSEPKR